MSRTIKNLRISGNFKKSLWQLCGSILVDGSEVILYGIAGIAVISGNFTLASLVLLLNLLRTIGDRIRDIRTKSMMFSKAFVHVIKLREVFDTLPRISSLSEKSACTITQGNINLSNICFGYEEGKINLSNFNLSLVPGSVTALVGPSGGGKSTIIKIIAGFIRPQSGSVIVDNQEIHDYYLPSYYRHIGYLTQEPSVFDGTVRENLLYGISNVQNIQNEQIKNTDLKTSETSEISAVLSKAQCQFVYDLPKGLDTEIGERGVRLSGGQRQRLAIAKIMLKNPKIILLDEPTSALDSMSEELVSQAMQELFKDRTVVIIAHRLQTVKHADRILYIDTIGRDDLAGHPIVSDRHTGSQIIEQGTHDELIALGGKYAKMVEVQTGF